MTVENFTFLPGAGGGPGGGSDQFDPGAGGYDEGPARLDRSGRVGPYPTMKYRFDH